MKNILYFIVSIFFILCLYSCSNSGYSSYYTDLDKLFYMEDVNLYVRLYKKLGSDTLVLFFGNTENVDSNNYIKLSPIYELPPARIIINKTDSIIYLFEMYTNIIGYKFNDFKFLKLEQYNFTKRGVFFGNDSILFSDLNNPKKEMVLFEIWPYGKTIEKWYTKPGWHKMRPLYWLP